jgi:hypothetical protein
MLDVHSDATCDLREIAASDRQAAGRLASLLVQLRTDKALRDKLLEHNYGAGQSTGIHVSQWFDFSRVGRKPVWRVKSWDLERQGLKYRIIYIFDWKSQDHVILAVVPRGELDYDDPSHPIRRRVAQRIRSEYPHL